VEPYEFDPVLRAMTDVGVTELNEKTRNATRDGRGKPVAQRIIDYMKFARQRAETGARLRVTHELTGMPAAYAPGQIDKGLVFGRVVQNTSYILQTPEGRALATAQALGLDVASLYGRRVPEIGGGAASGEDAGMRDVTETPETRGGAGNIAETLAAAAAAGPAEPPRRRA
jgi:hypothetical protein